MEFHIRGHGHRSEPTHQIDIKLKGVFGLSIIQFRRIITRPNRMMEKPETEQLGMDVARSSHSDVSTDIS